MTEAQSQIKPLSGVLNVDKAPGMTSHDVVGQVRRILREGGWGKSVKVGHAGTLDPDATGVLLVCLGGATRLADLLAAQGKVYQAKFSSGSDHVNRRCVGRGDGRVGRVPDNAGAMWNTRWRV